MRVLVTGASGFIGRATLRALQRRGCQVIALSRSRPMTDGEFEWHQVDVLNREATTQVIHSSSPEVVLHLAWNVRGSFWTSAENLDWTAASLHLARAASQAGAKRFVGVGTCAEYQCRDGENCSEHSTSIVPSSLYGVAKDATRRVISAYCETVSMEFAWARVFLLFGDGQAVDRLVPSLATSLLSGLPVKCTTGLAVRDFLEVRDVAEALAALACSNVLGAVNIGSGKGTSVADVAKLLGALTGRPDLVRLGELPDRSREPPYIVADVTRLRDEIGFVPERSLMEGLQDTVAALRPRTQT